MLVILEYCGRDCLLPGIELGVLSSCPQDHFFAACATAIDELQKRLVATHGTLPAQIHCRIPDLN